MSARFGGKYFLVEANPQLARKLRVEAGFSVWEYAVADREDTIEFHIAHNDEGSSVLELPTESRLNCTLRETLVVRARTLKSLIDEMGVGRIDLLKMDIEGAEVAVLRSLPDATVGAIGQMVVEFHSDPIFGFGMRREVEETIQRLRRLGFLCLDFSGGSRCDMLFVNRGLYRIPWLQSVFWESVTNPPRGVRKIWTNLPASSRGGLRRVLDRMRKPIRS